MWLQQLQVVLALCVVGQAVHLENEGNETNATTTTQTSSTTYLGDVTSSSTTCTRSSTSTQTQSTITSTSSSTTTVHYVTMSGRILVDVSEPERFSSSPEVVIGLTAALHWMFQVPAEVIDVVVDRRPGSAYAVQYAVTMEGAASTGSMIRAKEALIAATPHEIAQLFQREVNSRVAKAFVIVVMEVEPPTIHGAVGPRVVGR